VTSVGGSAMDRDFLLDLFSEFGPVALRRMFSGYGVSVDGTNFALVLRGGIYFRADTETIPQFEDEGCKPFQYQTRAKAVTVGSYWQLPERLYDDPTELALWARRALAAAERAAVAKRSKTRRSKTQRSKAVASKPKPSKTPSNGRSASKPVKKPVAKQAKKTARKAAWKPVRKSAKKSAKTSSKAALRQKAKR